MHVAYKKYKINRKITFFGKNTKYISLSGMKTSEFSQVHCTRVNSDDFNTLDEIYLVFTSKKNPLYTNPCENFEYGSLYTNAHLHLSAVEIFFFRLKLEHCNRHNPA